jgi:hypothetical protein
VLVLPTIAVTTLADHLDGYAAAVPLEAHVLLLISFTWLCVHVIRMPQSTG